MPRSGILQEVPRLKFSLVVATIGRTTQLVRLFETLRQQTCQSFEVILVDQNSQGYLDEVIAPFYAFFPLRHLRSKPGLSRARNAALDHIRGQIVAFPDDDCWYQEDLLERVADTLATHPNWDGLSGIHADIEDPNGFSWCPKTGGSLSPINLWHKSSSVTIFLRRAVVERVGRFDEDLGRGAGTGMTAAEESEYLVRALRLGFSISYSHNLCVFHRGSSAGDELQMSRVFGDSKAFGYVLRRHRFPLWFVLYRATRSMCGMALFWVRGNRTKTQYYWLASQGLLFGWLSIQQPRTATRYKSQLEHGGSDRLLFSPEKDIGD
jgi:glycosyltransferase involved in cell wall biosynthesis